MLWHHLDFFGFQHLGAPLRRNPDPVGKSQPVSSLPHGRGRKGVDPWTFLLGCVRVDHRNTVNQNLPRSSQDFLRFARWGSFEL